MDANYSNHSYFASRMSLTRIDPPLPLITPKGKALAHFILDYGFEHDLLWVCFQNDTGECWTWNNKQIRSDINITANRTKISRIE
jgi:hypothetical protein